MRTSVRALILSTTSAVAVLGLAVPANAASPAIVSRTPAEDAFVGTAPSGVTLTFDQAIAVSSTISVAGPLFAPPCNKTAPIAMTGTALSCSFAGGAAAVVDGTYTVSYAANSTGADPATTGTYTFHVDATVPGDPTVSTSNPIDGGRRKSAGFTYTVTASEDLDDSSRVDIFDSTQTQVALTTSVSGDTITSTPVDVLPEDTYTAKIYLVDVSGRTPDPVVRTFSVDDTAPAAPVITTPLAKINIANASSFPVSGTGEVGAIVSLTSAATTVTTTVNGAGSWNANINVSSQADGTVSFSATQADGAQNVSGSSAPQTTQKDTVRPRVTGQAAAPALINAANTTATVTGKVDNGSTTVGEADPLTVSANDTNGSTPAVVVDGVAGVDGTFSVPVDTASLSDGTITYTIVATDPFANPSNAVTTTNTKDTAAPATPTVAFAPASVNNGNQDSVTVSGAAAGATLVDIVVSDTNNGTADLTFTATVSGGNYSRAFDMTSLSDGTLTATVTPRDTAGNVGSAGSATAIKDVVAPGTPTVNVSPNPITNAGQTAVTVSGTTNGDSVAITLSDGVGGGADITGTATASGGSYSQTFNVSTLQDGSITVSAVASDTAGNDSATASTAVDKDTVIPGQPASLSATPTSYVQASTTVSISGTTAAGDALATGLVADITVSDTDGGTPDLTVAGVSVSMGNFSTSVSQAQILTLADGTVTVSAKIRDAVGNISPARTTTITKNTTLLALSVTSPVDGAAVQSPATISATYNENINPTTSTITVRNKNNLTVSGTASFNAKTASFAPSSALTEAGSPYSVTVHAVDAGDAGDVEDNVFSFSIDSTPGPQPTITAATDPVTPGNQANVAVSGSAGDVGLSVVVTIGDGTDTVTGQTTSGAAGAYTVAQINVSSLDDGELSVTARSTDGAGNQSPISAATQITKDTVAPAKTAAVPASGSTVTPPATVSITFDEPLGSGSITIPGVAGSSAVDGSTVTFTPDEPFADGEFTATATVTDTVGNEGSGATTFTVDGTGPVKTASSPASGATVTPPATVSITFDEPLGSGSITVPGVPGSSAVDGSTVTFTPDEPFADGEFTATASVTDALGNEGSGATTFTVDDDAVASTITLNPVPRKVTFPTAVGLAGQVTQGDDSAPYGDVAISVTDSNGTRTVATVTPNAEGAFTASVVPTEHGTYTANYIGDDENLASTSVARRVLLKVSLTGKAPKGAAAKTARIVGKVGPAQAGVTVKVYDLVKKGRVLLGTVTTNAKGKYVLRVKLAKGSHTILVKAKSGSTYKGNKVRFTAVRT
jgi:methionine-rich copper-binding protein CopC